MSKTLTAIDPGLSGGIAWRDFAGVVHTMKMPTTLQEMHEALESFDNNSVTLMEAVGKHRMGNSAQSSATFAKHVGHLEMGLVACKLPHATINATKWMNTIAPGRPKGVESATVRARKNFIKDLMQRRYPHLRVTNATADALGILTYLIQNQDKY